jgi:hypothetical protein
MGLQGRDKSPRSISPGSEGAFGIWFDEAGIPSKSHKCPLQSEFQNFLVLLGNDEI